MRSLKLNIRNILIATFFVFSFAATPKDAGAVGFSYSYTATVVGLISGITTIGVHLVPPGLEFLPCQQPCYEPYAGYATAWVSSALGFAYDFDPYRDWYLPPITHFTYEYPSFGAGKIFLSAVLDISDTARQIAISIDFNYNEYGLRLTQAPRIEFYLPPGLSITATPIPAALPLFATGLGAFGFLTYRRKRKQAACAPLAI